MIQLSNNTKYPDIAFEQENIQLSALHSVVILPPLSKIEMGKPLVVEGKTTVKSHSLFDDIRKQALETEIRNLLIHKQRFSKSSTTAQRAFSAALDSSPLTLGFSGCFSNRPISF